MSRPPLRLIPTSLALIALLGCGEEPAADVPPPPTPVTGSAPKPRVAPAKPFAPRKADARQSR